MKQDSVILAAGTIVEHYDESDQTWYRIPCLDSMTAVGEQSDPKDKTCLEDKIMKYSDGLQDAPDKNLVGKIIPWQPDTGELYDDYQLQQRFFERARNHEEFMMRVKWPKLNESDPDEVRDVNSFLYKALGYQTNESGPGDWRMFTTNGKQNTRVLWAVTVTGNNTVAVAADAQLTATATPADLDGFADDVTWSSSDEQIATVDAAGLVAGVAPGTVTITAEARGVSYDFEMTVS